MPDLSRKEKRLMQYTTLGNTGLRVSRLGFGAMRLPMEGETINRDLAIPMIHRAFEGGVNYIDTAVGYCNGDSQRVVGEALKGWRDKVTVSTKNHYFGESYDDWRRNLDDSLERLQIDTIDIYNTHGISRDKLTNAVQPRVLKWLEKARDEGLIRFICTSFHDKPEVLPEVVDSGLFAAVTVQYNMLNRELEAQMAHAREQGVGVIVMGPVGGGRLGGSSEALVKAVPGISRVPELAVRFVAANPNVDIVLSGMSTMEQVEENLRVLSDDRELSAQDITAINDHVAKLKAMSDLNCTGCGYCKPCPHGVNIPRAFDLYNQARVYGLWEYAREQYANWLKRRADNNLPPDACTQCGECAPKCPQKIAIPERLAEVHKALG